MGITVYCEKLNRYVKVYYYFDPDNTTNIKFSGCNEANGSCSMCAQEHIDEFFNMLKKWQNHHFIKSIIYDNPN